MKKNNAEIILNGKIDTAVSIKPDVCMINDGKSHTVVDLISGKLCTELKEKIVVFLDHDIPAGSFDSAFIQKKLIDFAKDNNLKFIHSCGIGYQVITDSVINPGDIFISCGNHSSIVGAAGALGLNVTPEQMADYLMGKGLVVSVPESVSIDIYGKLLPTVDIYDVALTLVSNKDNAGKIIQFVDKTDDGLTDSQKRNLCMLAARSGAVSALFTDKSDFDSMQKIHLDDYSPEPDDIKNIKPIEELNGTHIDACFIGGCSSGKIDSLRKAAVILKGKRIKRELRLLIGFASNEDYLRACDEGLIDIFFDCGAQVTNPGCASCKTTSIGVVGDGETLLSTGCYNYSGCSGTEKSKVYIASVETVAKAALTGIIGE